MSIEDLHSEISDYKKLGKAMAIDGAISMYPKICIVSPEFSLYALGSLDAEKARGYKTLTKWNMEKFLEVVLISWYAENFPDRDISKESKKMASLLYRIIYDPWQSIEHYANTHITLD